MKYFRVKFGYKEDEYVSIGEDELASAIRAQITGKVGLFREGSISGNNIMAIVPDFQRDMGWAHDHHLNGDDYLEIGRTKVNEYRQVLEGAKMDAHNQLAPSSERPLLD